MNFFSRTSVYIRVLSFIISIIIIWTISSQVIRTSSIIWSLFRESKSSKGLHNISWWILKWWFFINSPYNPSYTVFGKSWFSRRLFDKKINTSLQVYSSVSKFVFNEFTLRLKILKKCQHVLQYKKLRRWYLHIRSVRISMTIHMLGGIHKW